MGEAVMTAPSTHDSAELEEILANYGGDRAKAYKELSQEEYDVKAEYLKAKAKQAIEQYCRRQVLEARIDEAHIALSMNEGSQQAQIERIHSLTRELEREGGET